MHEALKKKEEQIQAEPPPTTPGLFDMPAPVGARHTPASDPEEEAEILAEIKQDEEAEEDEAVVV